MHNKETDNSTNSKSSRRKKYKILAATGLVVILTCLLLAFCFITVTPAGLVPYPLNIYKFNRACKCDFWLEFDKSNIIEVQSQNTYIFSAYGGIYLKADSAKYSVEDVIGYAKDNGWKCHMKIELSKQDLVGFNDYDFEEGEVSSNELLWHITVNDQIPLWIKGDCTVLAFETGNHHGVASFVIVAKDQSEMAVMYNDPKLPDGGADFWLPESFYEFDK